jgi:hypothetical protein
MSEKEKEIQKHMEVLGLTREEAEQLYVEDNSNETLPEVAEMEQKAKSMKRRYEADRTTDRKKSARVLKVDTEKVEIISAIAKMLVADEVKIANSQREITFKIGKNDYSLVLTKHRKNQQGA